MDWKTMLAYVTGSVDENLLLRIEYLVAENRMLRDQINGRLQLSDAEGQTLAEIGKKLGKQALAEVANIVKPDTILGWNRKRVAEKFDGSEQRRSLGRSRVDKELEDWVVKMAKENRSWGYDRIAGSLAELGYSWMMQVARNLTMEEWGVLKPGQYLLHDGDKKFCPAFQQIIDAAGVNRLPLPPSSPNLNAIAERFVRSVKSEALSRFILVGENSLRHVLSEYLIHYHKERGHQGLGNVIPFPSGPPANDREGPIQCHERLAGR